MVEKELANRIKEQAKLHCTEVMTCDGIPVKLKHYQALPLSALDDIFSELEKEESDDHWIRRLIRNENGGCIGAKMLCSFCEMDQGHDERTPFCPNCGHKMNLNIIRQEDPDDRSIKENEEFAKEFIKELNKEV